MEWRSPGAWTLGGRKGRNCDPHICLCHEWCWAGDQLSFNPEASSRAGYSLSHFQKGNQDCGTVNSLSEDIQRGGHLSDCYPKCVLLHQAFPRGRGTVERRGRPCCGSRRKENGCFWQTCWGKQNHKTDSQASGGVAPEISWHSADL